ncbi:MAG: hypothetical protein AAGU27_06585 [Dehalobacterium sp.]
MCRKLEIEFSEAGITVSAALLEKEEPELSKVLWNDLEKPVKFACYNTLSTGCLFIGKARPPKSPVKTGTQAVPVGKKQILLCDMTPGEIVYTGLDLWACYGPETEPLVPGGSVVVKVDDEDIDAFIEAGKFIWNAQQITHKLATMIVRRKES